MAKKVFDMSNAKKHLLLQEHLERAEKQRLPTGRTGFYFPDLKKTGVFKDTRSFVGRFYRALRRIERGEPLKVQDRILMEGFRNEYFMGMPLQILEAISKNSVSEAFRFLSGKKEIDVLDVGCGEGKLLNGIKEVFGKEQKINTYGISLTKPRIKPDKFAIGAYENRNFGQQFDLVIDNRGALSYSKINTLLGGMKGNFSKMFFPDRRYLEKFLGDIRKGGVGIISGPVVLSIMEQFESEGLIKVFSSSPSHVAFRKNSE